MNENQKRFSSWWEAVRDVGPAYLLAERLFYCLQFISPIAYQILIARRAHRIAVPKFCPIADDLYKIMFFITVGIILPLLLHVQPNFLSQKVPVGYFGLYVAVLVFQHEINVVAFDKFRGDRLPYPEKSGRFWSVLEKYRSRILPINSRIPL